MRIEKTAWFNEKSKLRGFSLNYRLLYAIYHIIYVFDKYLSKIFHNFT